MTNYEKMKNEAFNVFAKSRVKFDDSRHCYYNDIKHYHEGEMCYSLDQSEEEYNEALHDEIKWLNNECFD